MKDVYKIDLSKRSLSVSRKAFSKIIVREESIYFRKQVEMQFVSLRHGASAPYMGERAALDQGRKFQHRGNRNGN